MKIFKIHVQQACHNRVTGRTGSGTYACHKRLIQTETGKYTCEKCVKTYDKVLSNGLWMKLTLADATGEMPAVVFDRGSEVSFHSFLKLIGIKEILGMKPRTLSMLDSEAKHEAIDLVCMTAKKQTFLMRLFLSLDDHRDVNLWGVGWENPKISGLHYQTPDCEGRGGEH